MATYLHTQILVGNIYEIIDNFCNDLLDNISKYYILKNEEYEFKNELNFIIIYIKNDFLNKEYNRSTCRCFEKAICYRDGGATCRLDDKEFKTQIDYIKIKYIIISKILEKFINIFRYIYYTDYTKNTSNISNKILNEYLMIIIYGLYNLWNTIINVAIYINSFTNNLSETNNPNFTLSQLIIFLNYKKEIKQRYFFKETKPDYTPTFKFKIMHEYILTSSEDTNIDLYKFAATDILKQYITILITPPQMSGGKNKYKNTKNKITVIYKKKAYTRVIYICERKKYVKINKTFMLLSKLKKV
jgi:hypothetical protein